MFSLADELEYIQTEEIVGGSCTLSKLDRCGNLDRSAGSGCCCQCYRGEQYGLHAERYFDNGKEGIV